MGCVDWIETDDHRFACSEGHDVRDGLQSKDFECLSHVVKIVMGKVILPSPGWGIPPLEAQSGTFTVLGGCKRCPVFVQRTTGNIVDVTCMFQVVILDGQVRSIERVSPSTAEFLLTTPGMAYMTGCLGPISYEEAIARRRELARVW